MKIFNEEEVRKSADEDVCFLSGDCSKFDARDAFIHGVEYAESKVQDLCIEFAEFICKCKVFPDGWHYLGEIYSHSELFEQFLKERNNENN